MTPVPAAGRVVHALRTALDHDLTSRRPAALIVALSGGLDSCVLLHALRFGVDLGSAQLLAAHFDHRMRAGSTPDAAWVRGLCRAWGVRLVEGRVDEGAAAPTSEAAARTARYDFLRATAAEIGAAAEVGARDDVLVLTAHHADDQAETVLFRALRGTGIEGLAGIPARRETADRERPTVVRPLLDVWRDELEAYAVRHGLSWRDDPTNEGLDYARNVLRHEILPLAEEGVAPGARRSLVRLAGIARDEGAAWAAAMPLVLERLSVADEPAGPISVERDPLLAIGPELAARVLRHLAGRVGAGLDADTTRRALDFVRESQSGRRIELGGGVELYLDGTRVRIVGPAS